MANGAPIVGNTSSLINRTATGTEKKQDQTLGKDAFLKILITQLSNQDPTQPLQDKEFIAQMATFTSVEQLTNINKEIKGLRESLGMTSSLIGKSITWTAEDENGVVQLKSGIVDSILIKQGTQIASVNGEEVPMELIEKISLPEAEE